MRIAGTVQDSIVDGPGIRFTLFTQGCGHDCPGCQNPQTHDYNSGKEKSVEEIAHQMLENPLLDGLTLSGGEPFDQAVACAKLSKIAKDNGLNVWAYSGYTFEQLIDKAKTNEGIKSLLSLVDVLVDGEFELDKRSLNCKWRGSTNQRVILVQQSIAEGKVIEKEV